MSDELPAPTPEGELIRRAREAYIPRLSIRAAAAKIGLSSENWGYIERGYQQGTRGRPHRRAVPTAQTLAQMAYVVEVTPEELREVERDDAAQLLEEIIRRQKARGSARLDEMRQDGEIVKRMANYFEDESVPAEEKKEMAERFFKLLPWFMTGQTPPRELIDQPKPDDERENGSSRSA